MKEQGSVTRAAAAAAGGREAERGACFKVLLGGWVGGGRYIDL